MTFRLGGTTEIPRLGFGAMHLPGRVGRGTRPADRRSSVQVARAAVDLGVRHIDTAAFYRVGTTGANEILREALEPYPSDLTIATKVGPLFPAPGQPMVSAAPGRLRALVEENLEQLGVNVLDLVYLRVGEPDSLAERFATLDELRVEGLIRHLGVSAVTLDQLQEARTIAPVAAVQNLFGVFDQSDAAIVDACADAGIAFMPYFALGGGRATPNREVLHEIAVRHGATPRQVALAWGLHRSPTLVQIVGTSSVTHLSENMEARHLELSREDMALLTDKEVDGEADSGGGRL
ncbi:aldo/keto reductase [Streptomyces sp. NPDC088400]|uniref:aldo/keto reductase n=1 Tax=Streptomyces sp. NPDC088400 TaxID=3365861 RepID=UPI0038098B22